MERSPRCAWSAPCRTMSSTMLRSRPWSSTASHRAYAGRTVRSPSTSPWAEAVEQRGPCGAGHNGPPSRTHAMLDTIERETGPSPRHSVIWLHGLGADGGDFVPILPELVRPAWPPIRFVFLHAPGRPATNTNGVPKRPWYDISEAALANRADEAGVAESVEQVEALIAREVEPGVPVSRVFPAGFSQGGRQEGRRVGN